MWSLWFDHAQGAVLPPLPYEYSALEPFISARTLQFHHDKHHAKYVATTNDMIKGTDMENDDILQIIRKAHGKLVVIVTAESRGTLRSRLTWRALCFITCREGKSRLVQQRYAYGACKRLVQFVT